MTRRKNPDSVLPMVILLGAAAVYLFSKSSGSGGGILIGPGTGPSPGPGTTDLSGNAALIKKVQIALQNFLEAHPGKYWFPRPPTSQFDQATADAYVMAGNILSQAMQNPSAKREVLPTGTFSSDLTIPIVGATDPARASQRASSALLTWLVNYYYANEDIDPNVAAYQPPTAYQVFKQYALANAQMHPDERALRDAAIALYPTLYTAS